MNKNQLEAAQKLSLELYEKITKNRNDFAEASIILDVNGKIKNIMLERYNTRVLFEQDNNQK